MSITTLAPLAVNITQPFTTNIITTNYTTLPFLTLSNGTTDLPFLNPDPSIFSTDPPAFLSNNTFDSESLNTNSNFTDFDNYGNLDTNFTSGDYLDHTTEGALDNPFLANDYNWYDYNTFDPNDTSYVHEPYDYTAGGEDSDEDKELTEEDEEFYKKWDGVNRPPPIRGIAYSAATDLNPYFLWIPPIVCMLFLVVVIMPCIILKLRDDLREKNGKDRKYGSFRRRSVIRKNFEIMRSQDVERQTAVAATAAAATAARPSVSGSPYIGIQYDSQAAPHANGKKKSQVNNITVSPGNITENVLYIEENDFGKKKENGKVVSKRLAVDEPPIDYGRDEETMAAHSLFKEEEGDDILEGHRHSSSSGSLTPGHEAAGSSETSLGSSTEPVVRPEGGEEEEEGDEEIRAHRSGNFSTAPKTYTKFTGWNRDLYSSSTGFGPPARKASSKQEDGGSPGGSADKDWGMY